MVQPVNVSRTETVGQFCSGVRLYRVNFTIVVSVVLMVCFVPYLHISNYILITNMHA